MDKTLLIAVITGSVTAIGWVVNYILSSLQESRKQRLTALLKHTEQQLEQLYGPLAFLIIEGQRTFKDLLDSLGRNFVFSADIPLPPHELKMWFFWAENDLMPRNEKIKELLMTHTHLIESDHIPESYVRFLDHHHSWTVSHLRYKKDGVEYSWHSKINWPQEFSTEVLETFRTLKARHSMLISTLGGQNMMPKISQPK
jgi:hypothetical protein